MKTIAVLMVLVLATGCGSKPEQRELTITIKDDRKAEADAEQAAGKEANRRLEHAYSEVRRLRDEILNIKGSRGRRAHFALGNLEDAYEARDRDDWKKAAAWFDEQVSGKTPDDIAAAFGDKE